MFSVAKAKQQLQMFSVVKAKRQLQMFSVAKAKRQLQLRQSEIDYVKYSSIIVANSAGFST